MKWTALEWRKRVNGIGREAVCFLDDLGVKPSGQSKRYSDALAEYPEEEEQMVIMGRLIMEFEQTSEVGPTGLRIS